MATTTARPTWSGAVSFGMVQFPVRLYSAQRGRSVQFNTVHRECGNRTNSQTVCRHCERDVEREECVKGYEVNKGQMVLLEAADFEGLPLSSTKTLEVTECVEPETVPAVMQNKTYYVGPDERQKVGHKAFCLFREALARNGKVAVGRIAMSQGKELLCTLRPHGKALALQVLHWPDEIVDDAAVQQTVEEVDLADAELELADELISSLVTGDSRFLDYADNYRAALEAVIEAKMAGEEPTRLPTPTQPESTDLLAALTASVKGAKARKDAA